MFCVKVFSALTALVTVTNSARILGVVPTPSYSHQVVFQPIWKELSLRGHQVTTITTHPINDPMLVNLTEIDWTFACGIWGEKMDRLVKANWHESLSLIVNLYHKIGHHELSHPQVRTLIRNGTESFDVVLAEFIMPSMFAFAERFKAPLIVLSSVDAYSEVLNWMGNLHHPLVNLEPFLYESVDRSFGRRLLAAALAILKPALKKFYMYPLQQELINEHFGSRYPSVTQMIDSVSLVLAHSDQVLHKPKALLPTIVQFGGGAQPTTKGLPAELEKVLDAAHRGFIYFSLGSNIKSNDLPKPTLITIAETFSELPYIVLWKFEEGLVNMSSNVITSRWFPQQDVLSHPNIKLFINQGGSQSMYEAIYNHVPMVTIPLVNDQNLNAQRMVNHGCGLSIDHKTLNKVGFKATILEVTNNPKYRNKLKKLAKLMLDQPMAGLEKAIWWIEYVIRHNGTEHLKSPVLGIPFYQYYFLDVAVVFLATMAVLVKLLLFFLGLLYKMVLNFLNQKAKLD